MISTLVFRKDLFLGPILFLLNVNDINQHVHIGAACNLYADDTLVYCSANNVDTLQECTNNSIACIKKWYDLNKLVINTAKSNVMVVSSKRRHALSGASNIDVHLGNENIKQIDCIGRLRHVLAPWILMYIYQGIIQPRFDYALTIIYGDLIPNTIYLKCNDCRTGLHVL